MRKFKASLKPGNIAELAVLQRVLLKKTQYMENPPLQAVPAFSAEH